MWSLENSPEVLQFVEVFDQETQRQTISTVLNKFQSDILLNAGHLEKSSVTYFNHKINIILKIIIMFRYYSRGPQFQ